MSIIVFEDENVRRLHPVTIGRPAATVSCAGYRLLDWLNRLGHPIRSWVRPHLRVIQQTDFPAFCGPLPGDNGSCHLFVNARTVPSRTVFETLQEVAKGDDPLVVRSDHGEIAAVRVPAGVSVGVAPGSISIGKSSIEAFLKSDSLQEMPVFGGTIPLIRFPHDVVRWNLECFEENLSDRIAQGGLAEVRDGVFAAEGVQLGDYLVTDVSDGPIVLERNVRIGPHCFMSGPAIVGENSRIIEHSAIKDAVSLGHTTKIGGEVEASVIEPYTNKQHHGFLGHSYLGSWINLGAGTCNSDLKNTYGHVKMEYQGEKVSTGMQFVGCVMGDYAKSAINTGIFTGKTIGACSMVYGFVTTNVPSFVNYARLFGQVTELPCDVMVSTQQRMFARRKVEQRPCDVQLIYDMYELTHEERQLAGEPLAL